MLDGLYDVLAKASPCLVAQESNYQQNQKKKKTGPSRKLSEYEEFIMTLIRLRPAVFTFFFSRYN